MVVVVGGIIRYRSSQETVYRGRRYRCERSAMCSRCQGCTRTRVPDALCHSIQRFRIQDSPARRMNTQIFKGKNKGRGEDTIRRARNREKVPEEWQE